MDFVAFGPLSGREGGPGAVGELLGALGAMLTDSGGGGSDGSPFSYSGRLHTLPRCSGGAPEAGTWVARLTSTLGLACEAGRRERNCDSDDDGDEDEDEPSSASRSIWRGGSLAPRAGGGGCRGDSLDSLQHLSRDGFMRSWLPSYANVPDSLKPDGGRRGRSVCHITFFSVPKSHWRTLLSCRVGRMEVAGPPRCHPTHSLPNRLGASDDPKPIWGADEVDLALDAATGGLVPASPRPRAKRSLVVTADPQRGDLRVVQCLRTGRIHLQWFARRAPPPAGRLWPTPPPPESDPEEDLLLPGGAGDVRFEGVPCTDGEVLLLEYKNRGSPVPKGEDPWRRECFWLQEEWVSREEAPSTAGGEPGEGGREGAPAAGRRGARALAKQLMDLVDSPPKVSLSDSLPAFANIPGTGASVTIQDKNGLRVETVKPSDDLWKPIVSAARGGSTRCGGAPICSKLAASLGRIVKPKARDGLGGQRLPRVRARLLGARPRPKKEDSCSSGNGGGGRNRGSDGGGGSGGRGGSGTVALQAWFHDTARGVTAGAGMGAASAPPPPASITGELDDAYSECGKPNKVPLTAPGPPAAASGNQLLHSGTEANKEKEESIMYELD